MPLLTKPSAEARIAIAFITGGALVDVWCGIWYAYLRNNPPLGVGPYYWCAGFFLSGLVLIIIGLALGRIGRAARQAELPPDEVTAAVAKADKEAASGPALVVPTPAQAAAPARTVPAAAVPSVPTPAAVPSAPAPAVPTQSGNRSLGA